MLVCIAMGMMGQRLAQLNNKIPHYLKVTEKRKTEVRQLKTSLQLEVCWCHKSNLFFLTKWLTILLFLKDHQPC